MYNDKKTDERKTLWCTRHQKEWKFSISPTTNMTDGLPSLIMGTEADSMYIGNELERDWEWGGGFVTYDKSPPRPNM